MKNVNVPALPVEEEDILEVPLDESDPDLEDGADEEGEFIYDENAINMVVDFVVHKKGREALKEIAEQVLSDFDSAWDASEEYRERAAHSYKLFTGDLPPKNFPFKDSSNAHVPILLENGSRLVFRIASELFGDWSTTYGFTPIGPDDEATADVLTKHGNWQIRNKIVDFRRQMMRALTFYIVNGDVTALSKFDPMERRNRHDVLTVDEFVVPFSMASATPDYSDIPYKMQVLRYYRHELQRMRGIWQNVDDVLERKSPDWDTDPEPVLRNANAEVTHLEQETDSRYTPYKLIQYEGWVSLLPDQLDDRYVKVVVDTTTRLVLHLSIHEEEDWQDRARFDQEMAELIAYRESNKVYGTVITQMEQQETELTATTQAETAGTYEKAEALAGLDQLRRNPIPPPPIPPQWMVDPYDDTELPRPPERKPINMYSHGVCIEPLTGVVGIGYGRILTDLNVAANVAMSQFTDSATLNNAWGMLVSEEFDVGNQLTITPGGFTKIKGLSSAELKNAIMELRPTPANPQLIEVVRMAREMAQDTCQAPDVLSGAAGKSGETYRGHSARIEQATLQLGVVARNFANFFEQVLKNNAKLNSIYLPDEEIVNISVQPGTPSEQLVVRREMYKKNYQIEVRSDLKFTSMAQRIAEADEVLAMIMNNPILISNTALVYEATKNCLSARGRADMVALLGPVPPPPTVPMALPPPPPEEAA
jgi:hypothetical protein